ncbi:MAG: hemerythrin domain-containing protein [Actinobacteria bacterium ATB1]|nr:hemerythrin domain-containing protein [Actinobacteria bacterium ATB1]
MSDLSDQFSEIFREEHRAVRDSLIELTEAFQEKSPEHAGKCLDTIAGLTGPHFRYEEEAMYPALVKIMGRENVEALYADHDGAIASAHRLVELAGQESLSDEDAREGVSLVLGILPHVSGCDGLSLMVERLDGTEVQDILDARVRCNAEGADLLTWADEIRRPPALPVA